MTTTVLAIAIALALDFTIDLDSSGGWTNRGRGAISISSDGWMEASATGGLARQRSAPRVPLSMAEIDALQRAVALASRQPWPATNSTAADNGCCDRPQWTLRLQTRGSDSQVFVTTWYDGQEKDLRPELAALNDLIAGLLRRALASRGGKP